MRDRGFLVGDAAHRITPLGGIGMNTAIHDGHELGWRLAWACRGLIGDALLDSYGAERGPVGRAGAERSLRDARDPSDGLPGDLGGPTARPSSATTATHRPPGTTAPRDPASGPRTYGCSDTADGARFSTCSKTVSP